MKDLKTKAKIKILVAMSGGVDSSVAAALLERSKKYEVIGAYMLNYDNNQKGSESCWLPDYRDALRVAAQLGIPLLKFDFTKEYKAQVLDYMFKEYEAGRTPNPDVLCNTFIKFGSWLDKAKQLGFAYLATGHYASVSASKPYQLLQAKDDNKDQTYFLHQLNQEQLSQTMFPLGSYTKPQVRMLAKKFALPTANKEESMGICFVGEVPMKEFLEKQIKPTPGKIVTSKGEILGEHQGLPFYTIGERHFGLRSQPNAVILSKAKDPSSKRDSSATPQNDSRPLYVVDKRLATNELVVGYENDPLLSKKEAAIAKVQWVSGQAPVFPLQCEVRLRHRAPLQKCTVESANNEVLVKFSKPERAVTPGQFAVFYKNGACLGGGVIA